MSEKYLIVADDFTGSNDTGVQVKNRGIDISVVFHSEDMNAIPSSVVLDTESRGMENEEAYRYVNSLMEKVDFSDYRYVIKKVDSTLRGNVAEEIKAIDDHYKSEMIIFAPALPDVGRTTEGGIHMLNGVPISETEIGMDPKKPVAVDSLSEILKKVYDEPVIHIGLDRVRSGFELNEARIYTFDAKENQDMQIIISEALKTEKKILWVGSAAIAEALMDQVQKAAPALCICGSVSNVTREQIKEAEKAGKYLVSVDIPAMLEDKASAEEYSRQVTTLLKEGRDVILHSSASYDRGEIDRSVAAGERKGMTLMQISEYTQEVLGVIGETILKECKVSGVFLTGGDTAIGFLNRIKAKGSFITEEIAVGIPKMKIVGGDYDGLSIVTKAGAFGKLDAITYGLRKLKVIEREE